MANAVLDDVPDDEPISGVDVLGTDDGDWGRDYDDYDEQDDQDVDIPEEPVQPGRSTVSSDATIIAAHETVSDVDDSSDDINTVVSAMANAVLDDVPDDEPISGVDVLGTDDGDWGRDYDDYDEQDDHDVDILGEPVQPGRNTISRIYQSRPAIEARSFDMQLLRWPKRPQSRLQDLEWTQSEQALLDSWPLISTKAYHHDHSGNSGVSLRDTTPSGCVCDAARPCDVPPMTWPRRPLSRLQELELLRREQEPLGSRLLTAMNTHLCMMQSVIAVVMLCWLLYWND
jgi:hypothetical protein